MNRLRRHDALQRNDTEIVFKALETRLLTASFSIHAHVPSFKGDPRVSYVSNSNRKQGQKAGKSDETKAAWYRAVR